MYKIVLPCGCHQLDDTPPTGTQPDDTDLWPKPHNTDNKELFKQEPMP